MFAPCFVLSSAAAGALTSTPSCFRVPSRSWQTRRNQDRAGGGSDHDHGQINHQRRPYMRHEGGYRGGYRKEAISAGAATSTHDPVASEHDNLYIKGGASLVWSRDPNVFQGSLWQEN